MKAYKVVGPISSGYAVMIDPTDIEKADKHESFVEIPLMEMHKIVDDEIKLRLDAVLTAQP